MNTIKENLLLHPVRLRIILAVGGRQVTAQQLAKELVDIPQATLYRNINLLAGAGILSVVQQRQVHNTIEKTYALTQMNLFFTRQDLRGAGPEVHMRLFSQFLGTLLGYFVRYTQKGNIDFTRDHAFYDMFSVHLSDAEIQKVEQAVNVAILPYLKNEPSAERQRFVMGLISIPDMPGVPAPTDTKASSPTSHSDGCKEQGG